MKCCRIAQALFRVVGGGRSFASGACRESGSVRLRTMPINMFRNTSCTYTCVGTTTDVAAVYNTCWKPAIQLSCTATSHAFRVKPTISMDRCQCFLKIPLKLHRVNDGVVNMSHSLCS